MTSKIYCTMIGIFGFAEHVAVALGEDGVLLAQRLCVNKSWALHYMGVTGTENHVVYTAHFPLGWEIVWLDDWLHYPEIDDPPHAGAIAALALLNSNLSTLRSTTPPSQT